MEQKFEIPKELPADSAEKSELPREDLREVGEKATEVAKNTSEVPQIPLEAPDEYATNIAEAPVEGAADDEEGATNIIEEPGRSKDIVPDDSEKQEKAEELAKKQIESCIIGLYDGHYLDTDARNHSEEIFVRAKAREMQDRAADFIRFISKDCNAVSGKSQRGEAFRKGLNDIDQLSFIAALNTLAEAKENPDKFTDEDAGAKRADEWKRDLLDWRNNTSSDTASLEQLADKGAGKEAVAKLAEGLNVLADNLETSLANYYEGKNVNPLFENMNAALNKISNIATPKSEQI